jgi:hypothetical protein
MTMTTDLKVACYDDFAAKQWALNSAVECHPHTVEVVGSNPTAPTNLSITCRTAPAVHLLLSASPATFPLATVISSVTTSP